LSEEEIPEKITRKIGFKPEPMSIVVKVDRDFARLYGLCDDVIVKDGALPAKYKMLLVMCIGAVRMCYDCVVQSMRAALNLGATREEILEALKVAFAASGAQTLQAAKKALENLMREE